MEETIAKTLAGVMPHEFIGGSYNDTPAYKLRDVKVVKEYMAHHENTWKRWPGSHRHVYSWAVLENGKAVGWNENPTRGWSFPVISYEEQ